MTRRIAGISVLIAGATLAGAQPPAEPDLDVLLGLKRPGEASPVDADAAARERDRLLSTEEVSDEFARAVSLMDESSRRLADAGDPGLDTQRLQQDALKHLDKLIDDAKKRSSSKSKSKSKKNQNQQQSQSQQQTTQSSQGQSEPSPSPEGGTPAVPQRDGARRPPRPADAASWGNLPEHVRQALTQGQSDRFSSLYQHLTEQYYRRLAEEPKTAGSPR